MYEDDSDDDLDLENVKLDEDQLMKLEQMKVAQKRCRECSQIWCFFTKSMLESYVEEAFRDFECANKLRIKTVMPAD